MKDIFGIVRHRGFLFAVFCLFTMTNPLNAQWAQTSLTAGGAARSFAVSGTNLFAALFGGGVFLSTNNGTNWTPVGVGYAYVWALAVSDTNLFVGTHGAGVFRSTNNGTSWTAVNSGLTRPYVWALAVSGTNLFAGNDSGVFLSTNNGTSWTTVNSGLTNDRYVTALAVSGTNLFAGISHGGVFLSTNSGTTWNGVNNGLTDLFVTALGVSGANLFAGTYGSGVFVSTNNGTLWTAASSGLTNAYVDAFGVSGTYLIAGISGAGVWRRSLSEMPTSVDRLSSDLPTHFGLEQNYPNPFNPSTTISFRLPFQAFVSMKVFDALGREVSTLLSEELSAGTYSQEWNAAGLPSGVYFYRLQAHQTFGGRSGSFTDTRKLLLLR
jgi:hypothetical protein